MHTLLHSFTETGKQQQICTKWLPVTLKTLSTAGVHTRVCRLANPWTAELFEKADKFYAASASRCDAED